MSKQDPTVQKFMTCQPVVVEADTSVAEAKLIMNEKKIRHLPVVSGLEVKGVLSDRDIKNALSLQGADAQKMKVKDVCIDHPFLTEPDRPLADVAEEMARHHYGCAIVMQNHKVVGIFTTVDACRAIHDILTTRHH